MSRNFVHFHAMCLWMCVWVCAIYLWGGRTVWKQKLCYQTFTLDTCTQYQRVVVIHPHKFTTWLSKKNVVYMCELELISELLLLLFFLFSFFFYCHAFGNGKLTVAEQKHKCIHTCIDKQHWCYCTHSLSFVRLVQFKLYDMLNINFYMHLKFIWWCM